MDLRTGRAAALAIALVAVAIATSSAHDRITTKVTWRREISPLVQARCAGCHRGGGKTIPLITYAEVRPWAAAIKEEVLTRRMPKWSAARGYGDFANDPSLSPFEIALVAAWVDGGAPEGPPTTGTGGGPVPMATPAFSPPASASVRRLPCGDHPIAGRLLAVQPELAQGASAGIAVVLPGNRRKIVAWIRNYDPGFPETYWLRSPLDLPRGSRLMVEGPPPCSLAVTLAR